MAATRDLRAETNLGRLVAASMRDIVRADVGIVNNGGLRASIEAEEGQSWTSVTYEDILNVLPFGKLDHHRGAQCSRTEGLPGKDTWGVSFGRGSDQARWGEDRRIGHRRNAARSERWQHQVPAWPPSTTWPTGEENGPIWRINPLRGYGLHRCGCDEAVHREAWGLAGGRFCRAKPDRPSVQLRGGGKRSSPSSG